MSTSKEKRGLFYEKSLANKFINTMRNWLVARPYVQGHRRKSQEEMISRYNTITDQTVIPQALQQWFYAMAYKLNRDIRKT